MSLLKSLFLMVHLVALAGAVAILPRIAARVSRRGFVVFVAFLGLAFATVVFRFSEPAWLFSDFRKAYFPAARSIWENRPEAYRALIVSRDFVNLPGVGWLFVPFLPLGLHLAGCSFLALGLGAVGLSWWWLVRAARLDIGRAGVLFVLFAGNGPMINSLREGNTSHMVLLGLVSALLLLRRGRDGVAGIALGLCAVIKLPLLAFGVYFLLVGRWRVFAGGALVVVASVLSSVASFGWELQVSWLESGVLPLFGHPILAFNSQSLPVLFARLFAEKSALLSWEPSAGGGVAAWLSGLSVVTVAIAVAGAAFAEKLGPHFDARVSERHVAREIEICCVLVGASLVSTLAWTHYYLWLLVPFAFFLGSEGHFPSDAWTRRAMWCGLFLAAPCVRVFNIETPWIQTLYDRFIVSHVTLGGVLMFAALVRARLGVSTEPPRPRG